MRKPVAVPKHDKTLKVREGRNILYIELKSPYPELLKQLAESENRSMKAQAEVLVMKALDALAKAAALAATAVGASG